MRKKIIGAIIFLMLAIPTISALDKSENNEYLPTKNLEDELFIDLYPAPVFFGVNMDIENKGATTLNNVTWSFRTKASISGTGIFIREKFQEGLIDTIEPNETKTIKFRPFSKVTKSPLGLGNLYMNASAEADGLSVRTQKRAVILGFFLLMYRDTYMDIRPKEAYERWLNNEFDMIIDVVGLDIYKLGHLPGAENYVWADGTLNEMIPTLNQTWTYLVYCHTDPPSTASAQAMVNAGFKHIYRLEGNYKAWKDAGYPVETE